VRFSWLAARDPKVAWTSRSIVDYITDVEVHSPTEFTAHFSETYPYQVMDMNDVHVIPKHVFGKVPFEQWQGRSWNEEAKVSGGPWLLEKYTPNTEISFVPNPKYWDTGKPYLSRAVFKIQGSMETNLTALLAGDVDFMLSVTPKDAKRVLEDGDLLLYTYQTRTIGWIGWNTKKAPFDDARVRRAMTMGIDRENIVESILYGYGKVAGPVIIRSMWASDKSIQPLEFDPDAAEKLLDEAGWKRDGDERKKDGKTLAFSIVTNAGNDVRKKICEYVQANLRDIGVKVELKLQDFNQMSQQLKRHTFEAYVGGMSVATKVDGKPIFHSAGAQGGYNYPDYANKRVDEIIDQARLMSDQKVAKPLWDEMQQLMDKDQAYTTVYEPRGLVGLSKRFRNVQVTALRALTNLHEWWVPKGEQRFK
jgi:peptide/nickel transport system substrate-binding protein